MGSIQSGTQRRIDTVQKDFHTLQVNFKKEEEQSRIARKCTDNLQEEYCKVVHSVASEKQRNLMFIEKAKREFVTELTNMNLQVREIDVAKQRIREMDARI